MGFLIYLDDNGKEVDRKEKGRGRPPKGAIKKEDGNYYVPSIIPTTIVKKKKEKPIVRVEISGPQGNPNLVIENVRSKSKIDMGSEQQFSYDTWCKVFSHNTGKNEDKDRIIFFNPYVCAEIFAGEVNLFNNVFVWVEINKQTGDIALWGNYLRKRVGEPQIDSEERMKEYLEDKNPYGDQDYILGPPTYVLINAIFKD